MYPIEQGRAKLPDRHESFSAPISSMVFDPNGSVAYALSDNKLVSYPVDPSTGHFGPFKWSLDFASSDCSRYSCRIVMGPNKKFVYVIAGNGAIYVIDVANNPTVLPTPIILANETKWARSLLTYLGCNLSQA